MTTCQTSAGRGGVPRPGRGFTLIELLTVVAIISLLIGILVPSIGAARKHAKSVKTRATIKAIGDGLELFRGENDAECRQTGGYPPSTARDDPTEDGMQLIFGAQWVVRYLVGKDLKGFAPRRNVPAAVLEKATTEWEENGWYDSTSPNDPNAVPRVGPYVQPDGLRLVKPSALPGKPAAAPDCDEKTFEQYVAVDVFGYPILYYAANVRYGARADAVLASFDGTQPGVYTLKDNALFSGMCKSSACTFPRWDFGQTTVLKTPLEDFGEDDPPVAKDIKPDTFPYFVLNRSAWEQSKDPESGERKLALPVRKDSYLLIAPGPDGLYGTSDDVKNFE